MPSSLLTVTSFVRSPITGSATPAMVMTDTISSLNLPASSAAVAEAVPGAAAGRDRQAGAQRDLACDVAAGRAFGRGAAHQHVVDERTFDAGALDGRLDGMAAQGCAVGHVESALPALGERRA